MNQCLVIIKPNTVERKESGSIISIIEKNDFEIFKIMSFVWSEKQIREFYIEHKDKNFYNEMCDSMKNRKAIAIILKKNEHAIEEIRKLIGHTDPTKAEKNTIRNIYGISIDDNVIHASDSINSFERETKIIFS